MKNGFKLSFAIISLLLSSCALKAHGGKSNLMSQLFDTASSNESGAVSGGSSSEYVISNQPTYSSIDVDLTTMSATMVYSQVLNMMQSPKNYIGKVVKMKGQFMPLDGETKDICYPAIIVKDATECCSKGIEFLLYGIPVCTRDGGNGYPLRSEEATVVGVFQTYSIGKSTYAHLVDSLWLK